MPIILLLTALAGVIGVAFIVREVHEITEEPAAKVALPLFAIGALLVAGIFLMRELRSGGGVA